jgi:hypothetical protein
MGMMIRSELPSEELQFYALYFVQYESSTFMNSLAFRRHEESQASKKLKQPQCKFDGSHHHQELIYVVAFNPGLQT